MKKFFILSFVLLFITSCFSKSNLNNITKSNQIKLMSQSQSGIYLSSSYSILKGDVFSANKILKFERSNLTLLKLKFFSNLVSGNFEIADKTSKSLKIDDTNDFIYKLPRFIKSIENKNYNQSLDILKQSKVFYNFYEINKLLEYWVLFSQQKLENNLLPVKNIPLDIPIYKLLILENFYDIEKLKNIAEHNLNRKFLSHIDLLFLAGYYLRLNDKYIFNKIITRLSDRFNKNYIINDFSSAHNLFNQKTSLEKIISYYLYNMAFIKNDKFEKPSSYIKILLEMSIYFNSNMDISKYSLAEIYNSENSKHIALMKLDSINNKSYFSLASDIKKLSIFKLSVSKKNYEKLLFKLIQKTPQNKILLFELANFHKSNKNYIKALELYSKLLKGNDNDNRLLFLYATCLDKVGKWVEAEKILLKIIDNDNYDSYSLNYLSYSLAVKKLNLDFALVLIKRALKLKPDNPFFLDTLGWVQFQRKDYYSSVFFLQKAVTIEPTNAEIIDHLGDCYLMLNRTNEAIYEWNKAIQYETNKERLLKIKDKINKYE